MSIKPMADDQIAKLREALAKEGLSDAELETVSGETQDDEDMRVLLIIQAELLARIDVESARVKDYAHALRYIREQAATLKGPLGLNIRAACTIVDEPS